MSQRSQATKTLQTQVPLQQVAAGHRAKLFDHAGLIVAFLVILFFAILYVAPVYWMVITSLKSTPEVFQIPPAWWPAQLRWSNYPEALADLSIRPLRREHAAYRGPGRPWYDHKLSGDCLRLFPSTLARPGSSLLPRPGHVDDPDLGHAGAALHPFQRHRLG